MFGSSPGGCYALCLSLRFPGTTPPLLLEEWALHDGAAHLLLSWLGFGERWFLSGAANGTVAVCGEQPCFGFPQLCIYVAVLVSGSLEVFAISSSGR